MRKSKKRIRFAAATLATMLAVGNLAPIIKAEENYQFDGQALVDECGYYVKVLVTTDKEGHVLSVKDNGTESPKSSEHFWSIFAEKKDDFFGQYTDKTSTEVSELDVDCVSGATKTSKAAHEAVKSALAKCKEEEVDKPSGEEESRENPSEDPSKTSENEEINKTSEDIIDDSDYEIDEDGVLKEYIGTGEIAIIPEGVVEIDEYSFSAAENLKKVKIPASVEYINPQSFLNCPSLKAFEVDDDSVYFYSKDGVIYKKTGDENSKKLVLVPCGLTGTYTVADDVTVIGESAFYSTYLSEINISKSVKSIDQAMIDHAVNLEAINVDESNEYFSSEDGLLYNKAKDELILVPTGIKGELEIVDGVKTLGEGVFYSCVNLTSVSLPEGITEIPMLAFAGCTSLIKVDIPESVTVIGARSFAGTGSLESLTIPKNVSEFGQYVFANSTGMKNIYVEKGSKHFASIDGVLFTADKKTLVQYPVGRRGDYVVPDGTKCIGMGSFFAANFVEKVIAPDSVDTFGNPDYPNPILGSIVFGYFDYPKNLVLVAVKGSATESYANEFEIPFEELSKDNNNTEVQKEETPVQEEPTKNTSNKDVVKEETKAETKSEAISESKAENQGAVSSSGNGNTSSSVANSGSSKNVTENKVINDSPVALSDSVSEDNKAHNNAGKSVKSQIKASKDVQTSETIEEDLEETSEENEQEATEDVSDDQVVEDVDTKNIEEESIPAAAELETTVDSNGNGLMVLGVVLAIAVLGVGALSFIRLRGKR